jgi:alanine dehydrogenase
MDRNTLILSARDVRSILAKLSMKEAVRAVELAFAQHASGAALMPPKVYLSLEAYAGDFRAMPSFIAASEAGGPAAAGVKWVNSHPENPARFGLPCVMGVYVLSDPATALPLAVLDATVLTAARTAAAAAVASRWLAKPSPRSIGFVGAGVQARWMIDAHAEIYGHALEIVAADVRPEAAEAFVKEHCEARGLRARVGSVAEAAGCDLVCTSTPGRTPVVKREWIKPGAHINAMGADGPGKQELEPSILAEAVVVIDEHHQATHSGEINVPLAQGVYREEQLFGTLGELILGRKKLERREGTVTIFDSTGLAIQDVALARVLYAAAREQGIGTSIDLVG